MEIEVFYKIINGFAGAIRNLSYYPPGHPALLRQIQVVLSLLAPLLEEGDVSLGVAEGVIVLNSEPLFKESPAGEELKARFAERGIGGLAFRRGVTAEELFALSRILHQDPVPLPASEGLLAQFRKAGIKNIVPVEIEAVEDKAQRVYHSARDIVVRVMNDARLGVIPKVETAVKTIEEMADIMISDRNAILGLTMLSSYDNYTFNHSVNVGILALSLAQHLEHSETLQLQVGVAGLLHDIGKTFTPLNILKKPGPLSDDEWEIVRRHPLDGTRLIERMEGHPPGTPLIVLEHHMGYNLRGYPKPSGSNHQPHPGTGIVTISDCYDSMTTLRAYQERLEPREALKKMNSLAGKHFDPKTLKSFIQMLGIYPIGSLVRLSSGEIALVTGVETGDPNHPRVKIVTDREGKKLPEYQEMKLAEDPQGREIITTVDFMAKDVDLSA